MSTNNQSVNDNDNSIDMRGALIGKYPCGCIRGYLLCPTGSALIKEISFYLTPGGRLAGFNKAVMAYQRHLKETKERD